MDTMRSTEDEQAKEIVLTLGEAEDGRTPDPTDIRRGLARACQLNLIRQDTYRRLCLVTAEAAVSPEFNPA